MVKRSLRWWFLATVLLLPVCLPAKDLADYQIGDRAAEDIAAPHQLVVVDREATAVLRAREAQRVPEVMRYDPGAAVETETAFLAAFGATRTNFLAAVEKSFHAPPLSEQEIASTQFLYLLNSFQKQNRQLPVTSKITGVWVRGESDEALATGLAARLRDAMQTPVRADEAAAARSGGTVRLVQAAPNEKLTEEAVRQRGVNVGETNLVSLQRARSELVLAFPLAEHALAGYLASFIRPSCELDEEMTRTLRARYTADLWADDHYDAGQIIVRRGQIVDAKIKAALDEIREKTAAGQFQNLVVSDEIKAAREEARTRWLGVALGSLFLLAAVGIWHLARRQTVATLLPARIEGGGAWQQRALLAEHRADEAHAAVRAGVVAQLTNWLSGTFIRRLSSQHASLLDAQQRAASDMAELEARLEKIQAPLKDRLAAYECRIGELERELTIKGEENRELIRAKIEMIRKQWELEREKNRLELN